MPSISSTSLHLIIEDIYRCWAPERVDSARGVAAAAVAQGKAGVATLTRALEDEFGIPGYFANHAVHFSGRFFDARRALYDGNVIPPVPAATPFDNVHKAQVLLPGGGDGEATVAIGRLHSDAVAADDAARKSRARGPRSQPLVDLAAAAVPDVLASPMAVLARAVTSGSPGDRTIALLISNPRDEDPAYILGQLECFDADGNVLLSSAGPHTRLPRGMSFSRAIMAATPQFSLHPNAAGTLTLIPAARIVLSAMVASVTTKPHA